MEGTFPVLKIFPLVTTDFLKLQPTKIISKMYNFKTFQSTLNNPTFNQQTGC